MTSNKQHNSVKQNNYSWSHPTGTLLRYAHLPFMSLHPMKFQPIPTKTIGGVCDHKIVRQVAISRGITPVVVIRAGQYYDTRIVTFNWMSLHPIKIQSISIKTEGGVAITRLCDWRTHGRTDGRTDGMTPLLYPLAQTQLSRVVVTGQILEQNWSSES